MPPLRSGQGDTFTEVADEEIVKGYEYVKGQHVLIDPKEIDELKLEAKHTIDMKQFVDEDDIDSRYWEKPYYLVQMVTRLTRAIPSWHEPWPKQARSPLVNSSCMAVSTLSVSSR